MYIKSVPDYAADLVSITVTSDIIHIYLCMVSLFLVSDSVQW